MPGRKRLKQGINEFHAGQIERQADLLQICLGDAQTGLSDSCQHGEAIGRLRKELRVALNILNNLPPDYHRPNCHMSPEQSAWHAEIERSAKASLCQDDDSPDEGVLTIRANRLGGSAVWVKGGHSRAY